MKIELNKRTNGNTLVLPIYKNNKELKFFNSKEFEGIKKNSKEELKFFNYSAEEGEIQTIKVNNEKIIIISIKKDPTSEDLRKSFSGLFKYLKSKKEKQVSIEIPFEKENEVKAITEGLDLTDYDYSYKTEKKEKYEIKINFLVKDSFKKIIQETLIINDQVKKTRNLVNENSNTLTPQKFEKIAKAFAKENKLKIKVLDEKQLKKEGLNLHVAVGQSSEFPPRLIIVEYNGNTKSKEKIALVGKGITFDTGGINLKPTGYLEDMRTDMGGAATVFGAFKAAVKLKLKKNIILVMACAENGIGNNAYKPGDIYKSYKGISVEIGNTDAEGRLVLADALSYIQKNYKPQEIIDMATLTGACLVALGPKLIGMLGNNEKIKKSLYECGERTGDRVWELPIYSEHRESLKSTFADTKSTGGRYGGTITAAAFLEKFIEKDIKWTHLDIAGAARPASNPDPYDSEYATGKGVRLLTEYLKN